MFYILQSFLLFAFVILLFPKIEIDKIIANIIAIKT